MAGAVATFLIQAVISFAISKALSFVTGALFGKPQSQRGALPTFQTRRIERRVTAKSTDEAKHFVFGEALVSGPLTSFESSGNKQFLHVMLPLSLGQCDFVTDVLLNDQTVGPLDSDGFATEGRYVADVKDEDQPDPEGYLLAALGLITPTPHSDPKARISIHLGSLVQAADADAVAELDNWTVDHRGRGVTYGYGRLKASTKVWPNSFNRFSARARGLLLYDPREAGVDIASSSAGDPAVFVASAAHSLAVGNQAWIKGHVGAIITDPEAQNFGAPDIDKEYEVDTVPTSTTFTLLGWDGQPLALSTGGAGGTVTKMRWSDNWALCVRRWLTFRQALNIPNDDIIDAATNAAANVSDEQVALTPEPVVFTADPGTNVLKLVDRTTWKTGDGVTVSTTDTLPAGLAPATTYFVIRLAQGKTDGSVLLATTLANARALTWIDIADAGTGTHTITRNSQLRYTCNGVVVLDQGPLDTLEDLYTAGAGVVIDTGEGFEIHAGAAVSPSGALDESDMAGGELQDTTHLPMADSFNAARGVYFDPDKFDTRLDLPPFTNALYESEDGGRAYQDFEFSFTHDPVAGQRLLKIALERNRRGAILRFPAKPQKFEAMPWDVDQITLAFLGYSAADFRVQSTKLNPDFSIDITYREEAAAMWDWNLGDETTLPLAPASNLPNPFHVEVPGAPQMTEELYETREGSGVKVKAVLIWDASPDAFVTLYQAEFKLSSAATWTILSRTSGTTIEILDVAPGTYDFRVLALNSIGVPSDYATSLNREIFGLGALPAMITGLTISTIGGLAVLRWDQHPALDVREGGQISFRHSKLMTGAVWPGSVTIGEAIGGRETVAALPLKAGTYLAKAVDSSGNESLAAASVTTKQASVLSFTSVGTVSEHTVFSGSHAGTVAIDDVLKLDGSALMDDWGLLDDVANWDSEGGIAATGIYDFAGAFDFGSVVKRRLTTVIAVAVVNPLDTIDSRTDPIDDWLDIDGTIGAAGDALVWARETDDDPAGAPTWSAWQRLEAAEYEARALEFQARLMTADPAFNIHVSELTIDAEQVT